MSLLLPLLHHQKCLNYPNLLQVQRLSFAAHQLHFLIQRYLHYQNVLNFTLRKLNLLAVAVVVDMEDVVVDVLEEVLDDVVEVVDVA